MRRMFGAALVLGLALSFAAACASAPPPTQVGVVSGRVVDTNGVPLPGIVVTIRTLDGKIVDSVTTIEGGAYQFPAVPVGQYQVSSDFGGYTTSAPLPAKVTPSGLAMLPALVLVPPQ